MTRWEELSRADLDQVLVWAEAQPWAEAMAACQQDAEWHSEGDVWTHTKMVCRQLPLLDEWESLSQPEQTSLLFAALFHDAGKPQTSRLDPDTGRMQSPKHASKGEHLARQILRDLNCDVPAREQITQLVRYHGRPAFLLERSSPQHEVIGLSWLVSNKLLYLFAVADTRGRTTDSMSRPEEILHYWKLIAEESGCFETPYPFGNAQARFQFYRQANADLHYVPHEDYRCTVTLMSGLPGSGKDTWLANNRPELPVVSLDDIRGQLDVDATDNQGPVIQAARDQCRELLRARRPFAFSATNLIRQTRKRWIDLFSDYGARIEAVYVEPPFETILAQNKRREHPVPEGVIRELAAKVEPPNWAEVHDLVIA